MDALNDRSPEMDSAVVPSVRDLRSNSEKMSFVDSMAVVHSYPNRPSVATVSLSRLIDFSIQRTFHELIVLTELLPRKSDIERKIEIVSFANRTRQLFIRLLALVKWAGSASKVEKCSTIVSFLDKQSMLFTETADILAKMSRETLVQARLPCFQLPCAVEVLTLGTYSRLPSCIRDRIVPPDSITASERKSTLMRLDHIIQQRLVSSHLPQQMRNMKIEFGRVIFHVDHEFELTLTCMGDNAMIPWRVLQVEILVEDKETGEGKDLVHPFQVSFLHHLIQSKLTDSPRPLYDAYGILHSFCLSLQLEVLHVQSLRLSHERLGDFIRVEEYTPGKRLYLAYWREMKHSSLDSKMGCRICLDIDENNPSKPLQVTHSPELSNEGTSFTNQAIKSDNLSIEKLLIHATHERSKAKLFALKHQLQLLDIGDCMVSGSPPILQVSFLKPCMLSEKLFVTVDSLTGSFLAHIPLFEDCSIIDELLSVLKSDVSNTIPYFKKLRIFILKERYKKTAEMLPVQVKESLPFSSVSNNPLLDSTAPKLYLQFCRHHKNYLLVVFEDMDTYYAVKPKYYLLSVNQVSLESIEQHPPFEVELPKIYLQLNSILEIDVSSVVRPKDCESVSVTFSEKRKLSAIESSESVKKAKVSGFFIPEFAHLITFCEEKLAYGALSAELQRRNICHQIRSNEDPVCALFVDIIQFRLDPIVSTFKLCSSLLSFTVRLQGKTSKIWSVSLTFSSFPLPTQSVKEHSSRGLVYLMYDFSTGSQSQIVQMVDELIEDWTAIAKLYDVVSDFAPLYHSVSSSNFEVKSYSYKKLVLGYGINKNYTVSIRWKSSEKRFQLNFGITGNVPMSSNPHIIVSTQLQHEFNQHLSIAALIQNLNSTINPLLTVQNLTSIPLLGVLNSRPQVPVQTFSIIPQSSTHIRLIYRNIYCVDITFQIDDFVAIRDGAYSLFDKVKVLEELTPIQGLKAFLNKFVDKSATQVRRLSQTEDDNPPSPVAQFESVEAYLFQTGQTKTASPLSMQSSTDNSMMGVSASGVRAIHQSLNPGSMGSNPNTPSSPHTSMLAQSGYVASPSTSFPLASPPSHGLNSLQSVTSQSQITSSPSIQSVSHPEPSPANIFSGNSPGNPLHAPSPSFMPTPSPSAPSSSHLQSPASNFIGGQSTHDPSVNSPFQTQLSMSSPHSAAWPGSPSIQRPSPSRPHGSAQSPVAGNQNLALGTSPQANISQHFPMQAPMNLPSTRLLPQRSWAAAIPTLLTQIGFENMCRPHAPVCVDPMSAGQVTHNNSVYSALSQLERFLGCVFMRRTLQRAIQSDDNFSLIRTAEPGIIQFKNETMQFKISLHPTTMQSLNMKISPVPEFKNQWITEELDILERFFESKVVCAPYKPNAFLAYGRLLNTPLKILKDCIQLMRIEMFPERNFKWTIQLCLTIPPCTQIMVGSPGMTAILVHKNTTVLFFIQFTRVSINLPVGVEPKTLVVPFVYEISRNTFQVAAAGRDPTFTASNPTVGIISNILLRYGPSAEYNNLAPGDCCIFPAIREIISSDLMP